MKKTIGSIILTGFLAFFSSCEHSEPEEQIKKARAILMPTEGSEIVGEVIFEKVPDGVLVTASIRNLSPGLHGFHIHEKGDCSSKDGSSAGGHFNPDNMPHGGPLDAKRHVGDLGNIESNSQGIASYKRIDKVIKLDGSNTIVGKSVIVHEKEDDFVTQPTGDAGGRLACGIILPYDENDSLK